MKKILLILSFSSLLSQVWSQPPTTQVTVSRPTTSVKVSRPTTSVSVSRPTTFVQVNRPTTSVSVSHPTTSVKVFRPATDVEVSRPGEKPVSVEIKGAGDTAKTPAAPTSSQAKTSMSDYTPPQAKDFKAPSAASKLGGGDSGLGNQINESEKDASAKAFQVKQAPDPSGVDAQNITAVGGKTLDSTSLLNTLKQKAAGRSESK